MYCPTATEDTQKRKACNIILSRERERERETERDTDRQTDRQTEIENLNADSKTLQGKREREGERQTDFSLKKDMQNNGEEKSVLFIEGRPQVVSSRKGKPVTFQNRKT